jgi:hypothetical protein
MAKSWRRTQLWGVCSVSRDSVGRFEGISDIRPTSDSTWDVVEPSSVVEAMASAVDRVRRMAATVFKGDAALFDDSTDEAPQN